MEEHGYLVIRVLGQGGSCHCRVYEVRNQKGKVRVIKQLPWVSKESRDSALREVELLSSLRHPCIVSYLESFLVRSTPSLPSEDVLCLVMGRCERDLRQECLRLRLERELANEQGGGSGGEQPGFAESQVCSWLAQLCWGLQHLHSRKILHRDLKPQNVLLTHGGRRALLADFGVCGQVEHTEDFRRSIVGTPAFMSPEMLQGRPYGLMTDQWALGCVLYETMALAPPFVGQGESYASVVSAVLHSPPMQAPLGYSPELSRTTEALLSRKPHERPSNRELLRSQLLREPFHAFIRSLDCVANAASGSSSSDSASQSQGLRQFSEAFHTGPQCQSADSQPLNATIGLLTNALQMGIPEPDTLHGASATAVLSAALAGPQGIMGAGESNKRPIPVWTEVPRISGAPSTVPTGTENTPRALPEVTPRFSAPSAASSPSRVPGTTIITSLSCSISSAAGIGGAAGLRSIHTRVGSDIDEEPYGSDFESYSSEDGEASSSTPVTAEVPRAAQQFARASRSPVRHASYGAPSSDVEDSSNSFCGRDGFEQGYIGATSLDDVGLGRDEWRQLLAEAEALLHPETEEQVVEEAEKLRASVHEMLGGSAKMDQALSFLRNRRPLGETIEADELMLQVELGDLLGDEGLQALPLLERLVELEGAGTTMKFAAGALRPVERSAVDV